jgi:site-specific DNA-methyltransferase (adenine-specific)
MSLYLSRTENTKDEWETPQYFFDLLDKEFHFTLDPCATPQSAKCKKFYTKSDNGLLKTWEGETVFVNPPFLHIKEWVEKCYLEGNKLNTIVVLLLPSRTDTRYWHNFVMKAKEIRFCKGRVSFLIEGEEKNRSPFSLSIAVFYRHFCSYPLISSFYYKKSDLEKEKQVGEFLNV